MAKVIKLRPIKESTADYEVVEKRICKAFREVLYAPLIAELKLPSGVVTNDRGDIYDAIRSGKITFSRGRFTGQFSAQTSKALKALGAKWDRQQGAFLIPLGKLPAEVKLAIDASAARFADRLKAIDRKLAQILPEEIAGKVKATDAFSSALWKVERDFQKSVKGITVAPQLTPERAKRIAEEWQENLDLWIKDFTENEILKLREDIRKSAFSGNRYEASIKAIQRSYGVSAAKAKFLARQETSLLMTKFKETRYTDSGVHEYIWGCVTGSPNHPVRPSHKILEGKTFRWDDPPITTAPNEPVRRNNPGQDYNCRCFARPIVRFKE